MIAFVTPTDFTEGRYRIPNAVSQNAGEGTNRDLLAVIEQATDDFLKGCLTEADFAELDALELPSDGWPQKWKDFVEGQGTYEGLASMLIPFCYCAWLQHDNVTFTSAGGSKGQTVGAATASLAGKYVQAWNRFVELYQDPTFTKFPSFKEWLEDNDYDTSEFVYYSYENRFGLS